METDVENEQDQPEFLYEVECLMVDRLAEVPDNNSSEKDAGRAETNAAKFDTAERHAQHAHERQHADCVCDWLGTMQLKEPAQDCIVSRMPLAGEQD